MTAFNGQVALVTGASTGIGRYLAEALASRGMAVAGSARGEDRLRAAMDAVAAATGGRTLAVPADVTDAPFRGSPRACEG
jgi:short-subunit dehydrogenase